MTPEAFAKLQKDVADIKAAVVGNPELHQEGLAHHVKRNSEYIERDKSFKAKAVGGLAVLELIGIGILKFFTGNH